jgi:hypothetical protein
MRVYASDMTILKMMLRLFTSIFGTTHPSEEDEAKYAWMLLGLIVVTIVGMVGAALLMVQLIR